MSFTRKLFEGARSSLNSLIEKVAADDTPLSHVRPEELQAELEAREASRDGAPRPLDNPVARWAGGSDAARERRTHLAAERERRVKATRAKRARAQSRERETAFRRAKERAQREANRQTSGSSSGARSAGGAHRRASGRSPFGFGRKDLRKDPKIAKYYQRLDLPYGADFEQVKAQYRKLIRKYHPDLHNESPAKHKAATELTMQVNQAYNELEAYLTGGANSGRNR